MKRKCQQWNSRGDNQYAYVQKQDQMPNNKLFKSDNIYQIFHYEFDQTFICMKNIVK